MSGQVNCITFIFACDELTPRRMGQIPVFPYRTRRMVAPIQ